MENPQGKTSDGKSVKLRLKYDELAALYANQVIVNTTGEEFYLDFSSGVINDPATGEGVLSIHTRVAMSPNAARRLHQTLGQALARAEKGTATQPTVSAKGSKASLPKLEGESK